jgi:hypothetical protein
MSRYVFLHLHGFSLFLSLFRFHSYSPSRLYTFPRPLLERDDLTGLNLHWVEMYMVGAKGPRVWGFTSRLMNHPSPFLNLLHPIKSSIIPVIPRLSQFLYTTPFHPHSSHLQLFPPLSLVLALRARARTALANNQDQTINRLLRAQTSKSRSKLDAPAESTSNSPAPPGGPIVEGEEVDSKPKTRGRELPVHENMIRIVSKLNGDGGLINLVAVTEGREGWIAV